MVTPLPDGKNWRLVSDLQFTDDVGIKHSVPKGFVTDFASIPDLSRLGLCVVLVGSLLVWWRGAHMSAVCLAGCVLFTVGTIIIWLSSPLNRDALLDAPATLHDYYYRTPGIPRTRWYADTLLWQSMRATKRPMWKRIVVYLNVRLFGGSSFRKSGMK